MDRACVAADSSISLSYYRQLEDVSERGYVWPVSLATQPIMMLDYSYFPHIVENVLRRTDHATLLSLRQVSRRAKALADAQLFADLVLSPSPDGKDYVLRSTEGGLPVPPWQSLPASEPLALLAHTRVLDVHTSLPRTLATGPLLDTLAAIPTQRGEHHLGSAPSHTHVQEYALYMGSHWRSRTFYFEPPPCARYVVHMRYHVDRRLCELYGPAPSCARILAATHMTGSAAAQAPVPSRSYILIFSGSHEPAIPTVPTPGLVMAQRRPVHTLLYELAAAFEGVRRARCACLTLVGVEEFIGSLCGHTSTAEAAVLFERKLVLARTEDGVMEDLAPPVVYLSHAEYEGLVGARAYEAETRPMQLYS